MTEFQNIQELSTAIKASGKFASIIAARANDKTEGKKREGTFRVVEPAGSLYALVVRGKVSAEIRDAENRRDPGETLKIDQENGNMTLFAMNETDRRTGDRGAFRSVKLALVKFVRFNGVNYKVHATGTVRPVTDETADKIRAMAKKAILDMA